MPSFIVRTPLPSVRYSDFSKALLLHPGVVRIELLTDELLKRVYDIEYSPLNIGFMPIDPVGLLDISAYDLKLILFCSNEFPMFTEPFMDIVDCKGRIVGHDVLDEDKSQYDDCGYIWFTNNLFFDPYVECDYRMKCVIKSLALNVEGVPDRIKPRVYYPCKPAADLLNEMHDAKGRISATVLVGVDGVSFS